MPAKKRPAAAQPERMERPPPSWAAAAGVAANSSTAVPWAEHFLAPHEDLWRRFAAVACKSGPLQVDVWSDCSGLCTEMVAARHLAHILSSTYDLRCEFRLHTACDSNQASRDLICATHRPRHCAMDLFDRDWASGSYNCCLTKTAQQMPPQGIDYYVCGFPCTPWSRRGKRLGFEDANSQHCFACIKTIAYINPIVFVMENVADLKGSGSGPHDEDFTGEFSQIAQFMEAKLTNYSCIMVNNLSPLHAGFPTNRSRFYLLGLRRDHGSKEAFGAVIQSFLGNPLPVQHTYRSFLKLGAPVDWSRWGQLPTPEESQQLAHGACKCGVDPMTLCPRHPCKCRACDTPGQELACQWRAKAGRSHAQRRNRHECFRTLGRAPQVARNQTPPLKRSSTRATEVVRCLGHSPAPRFDRRQLFSPPPPPLMFQNRF